MTEGQLEEHIVSKRVDRDQSNPTRASVTFIVKADTAADARDIVTSEALTAYGIQLVEALPMMRVGISSKGIAVYCDKDGTALEMKFVPVETEQTDAPQTPHFYRITHDYVGVR